MSFIDVSRLLEEENVSRILVVTGILSLAAAVLNMDSLNMPLVSFLGFYFGSAATLIGFLVKMGVVTGGFSKHSALSSAMIVAAVFLFSGAVCSVLFYDVDFFFLNYREHPCFNSMTYVRQHPTLNFVLEFPLTWLFVPLTVTGLLCVVLALAIGRRASQNDVLGVRDSS